ncbi:MAG: hypothetical protein Q8O37_09480 [Sulfuricellaceae bacterium]|nr:hypothetical protein [Sulfuricellaceae bacterium]
MAKTTASPKKTWKTPPMDTGEAGRPVAGDENASGVREKNRTPENSARENSKKNEGVANFIG